MKHILVLASLFAGVLACAVPAMAADAGSGAVSTPIVFGQYADQSGPNASMGAARFGLDAYLKTVNAQGGIKGRSLRLVSYDDGSKPARAAALAKKLVGEDRAIAIVGSVGDTTSKAVLPLLEAQRVPAIGIGSGNPVFYRPSQRYVFPVWPSYAADGKTIGTFLKVKFPGKKIGIVYQNDEYGKAIVAAVGDDLGSVETLPFSTVPAKLAEGLERFKTGGVEVVVLAMELEQAAQVINRLPGLGYAPGRVFTSAACDDPEIFKMIPSIEGSFCTAILRANNSDPQWRQLARAMKLYEKGQPAGVYAAMGWLAGQVAVEGIRRINGPVTREAFVAALESIKNFKTIGGSVSYGAGHTGIGAEFIWEAKFGRWVVVPQTSVAE